MTKTATAGGLSRPEMWEAIRVAALHPPIPRKTWFGWHVWETFETRLGTKLNLTEESARRLELEYRRFLYLKTVDGGVLTPSQRVDQAWHLHMDAGDAWRRYCDGVLARDVEHFTGLSRMVAKTAYDRTLALYLREFRQQPPRDIWPTAADSRRLQLGKKVIGSGFALFFGAMFVMATHGPQLLLQATIGGAFAMFLLGGWITRGVVLEEESNCG